MQSQLGPRTIYYVARDGTHRPVVIHIDFGDPQTIDLGDGETIVQEQGFMRFECDWVMRPIRILGQDRLQVIYRLMVVGDAALQRVSRDNNLGLFNVVPADINEPMDVFA